MEKNLINVTCVVSSLYGTGAFQVGIAHCKSQYSYCGETVRHVSHCLGDDVIILKLPGICNRTAENYLIQSCDATNVFCIGTG